MQHGGMTIMPAFSGDFYQTQTLHAKLAIPHRCLIEADVNQTPRKLRCNDQQLETMDLNKREKESRRRRRGAEGKKRIVPS